MTTQSEVATLLPLITPYNLPEGLDGTALYNHTVSRVRRECPSLEGNGLTEAVCYMIAHILSTKEGRSGVTSEHLGQWSASFTWSKSTPYLEEYSRLVRACLIGVTTQVEHLDTVTSAYLSADNLPPGVPIPGDTADDAE